MIGNRAATSAPDRMGIVFSSLMTGQGVTGSTLGSNLESPRLDPTWRVKKFLMVLAGLLATALL